MKLKFRAGLLSAIAENTEDAKILFSLVNEVKVKKHKKHSFKKACPVCGKLFKGKKGVAKHYERTHSIQAKLSRDPNSTLSSEAIRS